MSELATDPGATSDQLALLIDHSRPHDRLAGSLPVEAIEVAQVGDVGDLDDIEKRREGSTPEQE